MTQAAVEKDLRYPIGKLDRKAPVPTAEERGQLIQQIAEAPARMREAVKGLSQQQLDTPYRPGGWTVRQVVHHVPDSHMNGYIRFKLALTEDVPTIKPYNEAAWAELADTRNTPIEVSLALLDNVHLRWVEVLRSIKDAEWKREFHHPEHGTLSLGSYLQDYAWHGRHHVAHITSLRKRMGW